MSEGAKKRTRDHAERHGNRREHSFGVASIGELSTDEQRVRKRQRAIDVGAHGKARTTDGNAAHSRRLETSLKDLSLRFQTIPDGSNDTVAKYSLEDDRRKRKRDVRSPGRKSSRQSPVAQRSRESKLRKMLV